MEEENDLEQPKTKKDRSPAQIAAFLKAQQIRRENAAIKKEKIAQIKEQYRGKQPEPEIKTPAPKPVIKENKMPVKKRVAKQPKKTVQSTPQYEEEEEEETIVIKKKPKKKIVYETDSESENDIPPPPKLKKEKYVAQSQAQPLQQIQRFYPSNHRQTPYGVFAII